MFDAIHWFLYDNRAWVAVVTIPVAIYFGRVFLIALNAPPADPATRSLRRSPPGRQVPATPKPVTRTGGQQQLIDAAAKARPADRLPTDKQPTEPMSPPAPAPARPAASEPTPAGAAVGGASVGDELDSLFGGLEEKPASTATAPAADARTPGGSTDLIRRSERLQEIGFHHSIPSQKTPLPGSIVAPADKATRATDFELDQPAAPAPAPAAAAPAPAAPAAAAPTAPTSADTPELDDILARLDAALADDALAPSPVPAKPATGAIPSAAPKPADVKPPTGKHTGKPDANLEKTIGKAPLWARADAFDEDLPAKDKPAEGTQLGLFDGDEKK